MGPSERSLRRRAVAGRTGWLVLLGLMLALPAAAILPSERIWQTVGHIRDVQIDGEVVAWMEDIDTPTGSKTDIYYYDGTTIRQVTELPLLYAVNSEMALEQGKLAWFAVNEEDPPPPFGAWLYLFDGTENRKLAAVCRRMPAGENLLEVAMDGDRILYTGTEICDDPLDDIDLFLWDGTRTTQYTDTDYTDVAAWGEVCQINEMELKFCRGVPFWIDQLPCIGLTVRNWIIGRTGGGNQLGYRPSLSVADYQGWGGGYEAWIEYSGACLWSPGKAGTVVCSDQLYEIRLPCYEKDYPAYLQLEGQRLIWNNYYLGPSPFPPYGVYLFDRAGLRMISQPNSHTPANGAPMLDGERIVYGSEGEKIMMVTSGLTAEVAVGQYPTVDGPHIVWLQFDDTIQSLYHAVDTSDSSVHIAASQSHVSPGEQFRVALEMTNNSRTLRADWLFSVEVAGQQFYYPDWGPEPRPQPLTLPETETRELLIFDFVWPTGAGAMDGLAFNASILWHDSPFVIDQDRFEWSFGPAKGGER